MALNIINKFYNYQLEKNPNYLREIQLRKYLTIGVFYIYFFSLIVLSTLAYSNYDNTNYIYVIYVSLLLHFFVYLLVRGGYYITIVLTYFISIVPYYFLNDTCRYISMIILIFSIFKTVGILTYYSTKNFVLKEFKESFLVEIFEWGNKFTRGLRVLLSPLSLFFKNKILTMKTKRIKREKTNEKAPLKINRYSCEPVDEIQRFNLLQDVLQLDNERKVSVFSTKEKVDFIFFLESLPEHEKNAYYFLAKSYPLIFGVNVRCRSKFYENSNNRHLIIDNGFFKYSKESHWENHKQLWKLIKELEPNIIIELIENKYSIIEALYLQDYALTEEELMTVRELEENLRKKIEVIESKSHVKSWRYKIGNRFIKDTEKSILKNVFDSVLKERHGNAYLVMSLLKLFQEVEKINAEILTEDDMIVWMKIFEHSKKLFFFNSYMLSSIDTGKWETEYDLDFPENKWVKILLNEKGLEKEILNHKEVVKNNKLLKF